MCRGGLGSDTQTEEEMRNMRQEIKQGTHGGRATQAERRKEAEARPDRPKGARVQELATARKFSTKEAFMASEAGGPIEHRDH